MPPILSVKIRMLTLSDVLLIIVISLGHSSLISVLINNPHPHPLAQCAMSLNEGKRNEAQNPRWQLFRLAIFGSELHTTHGYPVMAITALVRPNDSPLSSISSA